MVDRRNTIRSCRVDLATLISPTQLTSLPFPQSFHPLPTDRFCIKPDGTFDYMGREKFNDIYQQWHAAFVQHSGLLVINVYGTPGSVDRYQQHALGSLVMMLMMYVICLCTQIRQESHARRSGDVPPAAQVSSGLYLRLLSAG